jgi:hypothetical protein
MVSKWISIAGLLGYVFFVVSVDHNNTQNSTVFYDAVSLVDVWQPPPENNLYHLRKHVV